MKTISLDIETTGVNTQEDQIIQIGLVAFDTLWSPKEFLENFACTKIYIASEKYSGHAVALHMNADKMLLAHKLNSKKNELCKNLDYVERYQPDEFTNYADKFEKESYYLAKHVVYEQQPDFKEVLSKILSGFVSHFKNESRSVNITGKNAAGFDMKFIERYVDQKIFSWKRRILDVGSLYACASDDCIPDLTECMKRCGIIYAMENYVSHDAMDDAFDTAMCTYLKYQTLTVEQIKVFYQKYYEYRDNLDTILNNLTEQEFNFKKLKESNQI